MASLYQIDERLRLLEEIGVDNETGEILEGEEFDKLLDQIQMSLNDKIEQTMLWTKDIQGDIEKIKAEEDRLKARRKQKEKFIETLQARIDNYIKEQHRDEKGDVNFDSLSKYIFETPRLKLSYRKSTTVEIDDVTQIPDDFLDFKTTSTPKKKELKKYMNDNKLTLYKGVRLQTNANMQVK